MKLMDAAIWTADRRKLNGRLGTGRCCPNARGKPRREDAKVYRGVVWRRREVLGGFTAVKKQLCAHSTGRLAVGDQSDQRERWYGSLRSDWAVRTGGRVRGYCS